ncbi:Dicer-like protein 1 [Clarireedia jacksonii]
MVVDGNSAPSLLSRESTNLLSSPGPVGSIMTPEITLNTALAPRTVDDVFADLRRPLHPQPSQIRVENGKGVRIATNSVEYSSGVHEVNPLFEEDENEEEEPSNQPIPEVKLLSARKQKHNAIFDSFLFEATKNPKGEKSTSIKDDAKESTRWLIDQAENQQIISSPRDYQIELFERAKEKNIIAVLDTGSGKTLIAVLLLRHIFAQELEDRARDKPRRVSFFLVDSVTLCFQQHAVLKANLDQPMEMFCGTMGTDLSDAKKWRSRIQNNMVIICTAEILRQCLHHSFVTMEQINLMIFDEAHHAKKDHPYARIIKDFYHTSGAQTDLPKIFGMTASPVDARTDVGRAAAELEGLLHSQIATAADPSLMQYSIKEKPETIAYYDPLGLKFHTPLYNQMAELLGENSIFRKAFIFASEQSRILGSWCVDQLWKFCLEEVEVTKLKAKTEQQHHKRRVPEHLEMLETRKEQVDKARRVIEKHVFDPPHLALRSSDNPSNKIYYSNNMSTKVITLISILKDRFQRPTNDKCIVFVRQRYTARLLASLLSQPSAGTPFLKAAPLVGSKSDGSGDLNLSFREQVLTMMDFRNGKTNCLIATSVAEEGLDIPDCNVVVRFDLYDTVIQYIQSRGRARHASSKYYHMIESSNEEHIRTIKEVLRHERLLKQFAAALPEDRKLTGNDFDMDYFLKKERNHRVHVVKSSGARLTYKISLTVLSSFVDSLPNARETNIKVDYIVTTQNKQFICEVILPEESPVRGAVGKPASTKQVAKCSAAFETCLLLRKGGYLDEWLISTFKQHVHVMRNAVLAVDSKKRESYEMRTKPTLWSVKGVPGELFMTVMSLKNPSGLDRMSQSIAILTRSALPELPSFMLHFGGGRNSAVDCTSIRKPLQVDVAMLEKINVFSLCVFLDVFSKEYQSDVSNMPYFLVPVVAHSALITPWADPSTLIAWKVLDDVQAFETLRVDKPWGDKPWLGKDDEYFKDKYIVDPFDGSRKLWSIGVSHNHKPLDPVPPNTAPRPGARKNNSNIMEYSCSLWSKARAKRSFDPEQPVIEATYVSLRRNLLDEFDDGEVQTPKKCYVILEPLKISPIPTTVVSMVYLFPAIIHRIESYLIALEACALLHLDIRPDLALEALTKDSDNTEDHEGEQINFQRGMGNNYERLEFLGDCFLKMATSISLYGINPDSDEYRYHVDRMCLICNKNLYNNALKLGLHEYIRSQSFNRRAWYPEGLVLLKGKTATAPRNHKLGDKSIADVCEALIGAALLSSHNVKSMDSAVRAVTEVVCSPNHQATQWSDYYKLYQKPKFQTAPATAAQMDLAKQVESKHPYHFNYPRLLRSAFIHPTYLFVYEHVPNYQRLEFLGDALLDMACVNYLFHNHPTKDPQWLTEHKMAMVSNQFLGALCVHLGFHTHLLTISIPIQKQVTDYVSDITEALHQAREDAKRSGKCETDYSPDYWIGVRQPPKCLPDIVEAYIGAMFVDSEYDFSQVEKFFDMHIKWYFRDMSIFDTYANKHPTTFLTSLLQKNMGCQDWASVSKELPGEDGRKNVIWCGIIVHGQVVAAYQAESMRYAKIGVARKALAELDGIAVREFREKFGCACKLDVVDANGLVEFVETDEAPEVHEKLLTESAFGE